MSAAIPLRDIMEDAADAMQRLQSENPKAFKQFVEWALAPSHTQSVVLNFHGAKLQTVERREVIR